MGGLYSDTELIGDIFNLWPLYYYCRFGLYGMSSDLLNCALLDTCFICERFVF